MKINCIVIDDEPIALQKLESFVKKYPTLNLLKTFSNAIEALSYIKENQVDMIFLDIEMPDLDGFSLLNTLTIKPKIIIVTAFREYAVKSYDYDISDYLLKPYSFDRFVKAVEKTYQEVLSELPQHNYNSVFIKNEDLIEKINFDEILFIKSDDKYVKIFTNTKTKITNQTMKSIELVLPIDQFLRVHKSYIVSVSKIESLDANMIKIDKHMIPISLTYKNALYQTLKIS